MEPDPKVGFAEHITSDIGSLGDFAAGAETAFGTVLQRCYSFLGGRMHYGHPDMMNKDWYPGKGSQNNETAIKMPLAEAAYCGSLDAEDPIVPWPWKAP